MNLPALVSRLKKGGQLSRSELQSIRERLAGAAHGDDVYHLARALGLGAPASGENIRLLESFLTDSTDDWGLHGVINALCLDWGLTANYLDRLLELTGPRTWVSMQSASISALTALGGFLQDEQCDRPTVSTLLRYLESAPEVIEANRPASVSEYQNQVRRVLDQWLRGHRALMERTRFDPASELYKSVLAKFHSLP